MTIAFGNSDPDDTDTTTYTHTLTAALAGDDVVHYICLVSRGNAGCAGITSVDVKTVAANQVKFVDDGTHVNLAAIYESAAMGLPDPTATALSVVVTHPVTRQRADAVVISVNSQHALLATSSDAESG